MTSTPHSTVPGAPSGRIVLYDLEYTSWPGCQERGWGPGQHREIVQIGAVLCDFPAAGEPRVVRQLSLLTRPVINPVLSEYFVNLTRIDQRQVDAEGVSIRKGLRTLHNFSGGAPCYSYGNDFDVILENLVLQGIEDADLLRWGSQHFDLRPTLEAHEIDTSQYTSGTVHDALGLAMPGGVRGAHDALHDCMSMFVTLAHVLSASRKPPHAALSRYAPDMQ